MQASTQLGIDTIFTLVGDHLNDVLPAAARQSMRIVDMRHESGVTHAAETFARLHRRPAMSLVTGGPGHTNSLTGMATAQLAGSPLIAVSGSRPSTMRDRQAFQDIDQVGMARPVVKWAAEPPRASQIPFYLERAYAIASSGRMGAVHLTIPVDIFAAEAAGPYRGVRPAPPARPVPQVHRAMDLLKAAQRPVVIAGSGVWWSQAEAALRRFIERTSLPLYTITMARGVVPDDHPLVMGFADPALNRAAVTAFREADLFLIVGKRIDYRLAMGGPRLFPEGAKFIQIDIHEQELGLNHPLDEAVHGDARAALEEMTPRDPWPEKPWLARLRGLRAEWEAKLACDAADNGAPMHPAAFFRELRCAIPAETLFSWDGGDFTHWGRALMPACNPGGWLRLGPLAAIGSSLPNAIGLQLANPGRPVLAITGDGSLGFYLAEMDSLVRHKLPVILIVGNDAGWGLERELQGVATGGQPTTACELAPARYDLIMQAFGGGGETIERPEQVRPAIERALAFGAPYCINVKIRGVRSPFTEWQIAGKAANSQ